MVLVFEMMRDLVRAEQGWWYKSGDGVWRFRRIEDRISKALRLREGEGLESVKNKVYEELIIDRNVESIELTYEMPEWMDVDGLVKPVPIHIKIDDDMDLFMAMRVDIHELKLYVIPLPKSMTLDIDGFAVVSVDHGFADAEVIRLGEEGPPRQGIKPVSRSETILCTQPLREEGEGSGNVSKTLVDIENESRNVMAIQAELVMQSRKRQAICIGGSKEAAGSNPVGTGKNTDEPLTTKNLFPIFESVGKQ